MLPIEQFSPNDTQSLINVEFEVPEDLRDIVTLAAFDDPLTLPNGHSYNRDTLNQKTFIQCPLTRQLIPTEREKIVVNKSLANLVAYCKLFGPNWTKQKELPPCFVQDGHILVDPVLDLATGFMIEKISLGAEERPSYKCFAFVNMLTIYCEERTSFLQNKEAETILTEAEINAQLQQQFPMKKNL